MEIFDISQTLDEGIAVWPGDPEFRRSPVLRIDEGKSSNVSAIHFGTHTGTHIDAPLHVDGAGQDVSRISLHHCIGPARVISIPTERCIRASDLVSLAWGGVERVLFRTKTGGLPESSFGPDFVYIDKDAAEFIVEREILLVGTDAPSVDSFNSTELPSHNALLRNGIVVVENLRLGNVPPGDYGFVCLPLKIAGADGSPARAILFRE